MDTLEAIKYLVENSKYSDEWSGAGMWTAVLKVMEGENKLTKKYLDKLLLEAENF